MDIIYRTDVMPDTAQVIEVYKSSGLNRPIDDEDRIAEMYSNSNLIITAWHDDKLVGVARSLTDFCYCCYLSDLAVHDDYKQRGIGKKLIALTQQKMGDTVTLILLSAPGAMEYYPKMGFDTITNGFIINRKR
ncbi:GNAT family N-acetyltransferase [Flavobacterium sp. RHBU_24]|uniref:GNAT family N-acetyltransferase n=1 Tax=Flavobacterium sp. RHBU_24 TaxID=3391185 RepID=UPI0039849E45